MSRTRIYPTKENTIASGVYESFNSSQNAVADLWYGGGVSSGSDFRTSISRHLLYFDLSALQQKIAEYEINTALTVTYRLRMKNAVPSDKVLDKEQEFNKMQRAIAASFDLVAFPIDKAWDEGRGYDLIKERSLVDRLSNPRLTGYSNWVSATAVDTWTEPGVFANPTASTTNFAYQHFSTGGEDMNIDVTHMVKSWLSGGSVNHGVAVAYARGHETLTSNTRYVSSFFTHNTNYAFKPYLEVIFDDQSIEDDRTQMTNNRRGRLFLYTFSGNGAANYYSASTVSILDSNNTVIHSGLVPVHLEKGVYYVDVFMSGSSRGQKYKDVWAGVTFTPGYDVQNITQSFSIQDSYYANTPDINEYAIDVYGITNGATVTNDEVIRVYCDLRVNYSLSHPSKSYVLLYRLVMNEQEETIPWTKVNQAVISGKRTNYFTMDTSWLLHNQTYSIQFKIEELGTSRILPFKTTFKVLRPF